MNKTKETDWLKLTLKFLWKKDQFGNFLQEMYMGGRVLYKTLEFQIIVKIGIFIFTK